MKKQPKLFYQKIEYNNDVRNYYFEKVLEDGVILYSSEPPKLFLKEKNLEKIVEDKKLDKHLENIW